MNHEFEIKLYEKSKAQKYLPIFGNPHRELCAVKDSKAFIKVGREMGIGVKILARSGQKYIGTSEKYQIGSDGSPVGVSINFSTHKVPKGSVYLEITNEIRKMSEFYTKVDTFGNKPKVLSKTP